MAVTSMIQLISYTSELSAISPAYCRIVKMSRAVAAASAAAVVSKISCHRFEAMISWVSKQVLVYNH